MTVSTGPIVCTYAGDGVQDCWPVPFVFFAPDEVGAMLADETGRKRRLEYGREYSVEAVRGADGGSCRCSVKQGQKLTVFLDIAPTQDMDLRNTGVLDAELLERAFDKLTLLNQQVRETLGRCVQVGMGESANPEALLAAIDEAAAVCAAGRNAAEQARDEAVAAQAQAHEAARRISLPDPAAGSGGKLLTVTEDGRWILGRRVGCGDNDIPVNSMLPAVSQAHAPQSIIQALRGLRPEGWTAADCDAPVLALLPGCICTHGGRWSPAGVVSASSEYSSAYSAGNLVNGSPSTDGSTGIYASAGNTAWVEYRHPLVRKVRGFSIRSRNHSDATDERDAPHALTAYADGAEVKSFTTGVWTKGQLKRFDFDAPVHLTALRVAMSDLTGANIHLSELRIHYEDVPEGAVAVPAGLQVAYADGGCVRSSVVLPAYAVVDLTSAADGVCHIYADMAADGTFSGFGHTDIPPETGTSRGGADVIPAFSGYTLAGWGTVSADSESDPLYAAWKAFNRTAADSNDFWGSGRNDGTGWLRMVFTAPRTVVGYMLVPRSGGTNSWMPKAWKVKYGGTDTPDTTAQVVSGFVFPGQGIAGKSVFMLDAPVTAASIEIEVTASADPAGLVGLAMFVPLFAGDFFDTAAGVMHDCTGAPVRRVYLGRVEKNGGTVRTVHSYGAGTVAVIPVNAGEPVAKNSAVIENLPFPYACGMTAEPQLHAEGFWGKAGWIFTSAGIGVSASVRDDGVRVFTGGAGLASQPASIGGDFSAGVPGPARIRAIVHRGY
ncbi:hypothetical protein [Oleidesulfovibrio alaskensis]|uniref:hypothetical protein n=1 Tax=Oleidesulfovibrio alaskensis TaxID=58180 RepID=UPI001A47641E|nr:hypothetical protein [Oleidesulfovibrio alaskensis]MBL3582470.1 hypothetical protein [Oleidesulfovibrio alaskensis]